MGRTIITEKDVAKDIIDTLHGAGDDVAGLPEAKIVYTELDRGVLLEAYGDKKEVIRYAYDSKEKKTVLKIFELVVEELEKEYQNEVVKRNDYKRVATFTR